MVFCMPRRCASDSQWILSKAFSKSMELMHSGLPFSALFNDVSGVKNLFSASYRLNFCFLLSKFWAHRL